MASWTELEPAWTRLIDAFTSFVTVASNSDKNFGPFSQLHDASFSGKSGDGGSNIDEPGGAKVEEELRSARVDPQAALQNFDLKVAKAVHTAMQQGLVMQEQVT